MMTSPKFQLRAAWSMVNFQEHIMRQKGEFHKENHHLQIRRVISQIFSFSSKSYVPLDFGE